MMRYHFNWAESFKKKETTYEDILKKVRKTENDFWTHLLLSLAVTIIGIMLFTFAPEHNLKLHAWGLFLATAGLISGAILKLWGQMMLLFLHTIWDSRVHIEAEIRKSEAADL